MFQGFTLGKFFSILAVNKAVEFHIDIIAGFLAKGIVDSFIVLAMPCLAAVRGVDDDSLLPTAQPNVSSVK